MRRQRNAKLVATLGPASSTPEVIRSLYEAGSTSFPARACVARPDPLAPGVQLLLDDDMVAAGTPIGVSGTTNMLKIMRV
jgi:pyruvate kinase